MEEIKRKLKCLNYRKLFKEKNCVIKLIKTKTFAGHDEQQRQDDENYAKMCFLS